MFSECSLKTRLLFNVVYCEEVNSQKVTQFDTDGATLTPSGHMTRFTSLLQGISDQIHFKYTHISLFYDKYNNLINTGDF